MHRASCGPNRCYAAIRARTLMRRQLPNKHREPPVNTVRTSERKSKESAHFGCHDTAHARPGGALRHLPVTLLGWWFSISLIITGSQNFFDKYPGVNQPCQNDYSKD